MSAELNSKANPAVNSSKNSDKRYLPRWEVGNKILYQQQGKARSAEALSHDLSCAGTSILADEDIQLNQKLKLTIYLDQNTSIRVDGRVCWSKQADSKHLIGVNFEQTSRKAQDLILKYAFELDREKLVNHWFKGWEGA